MINKHKKDSISFSSETHSQIPQLLETKKQPPKRSKLPISITNNPHSKSTLRSNQITVTQRRAAATIQTR